MQFRGVVCLVHLDGTKGGPHKRELMESYSKLELRRALLSLSLSLFIYVYVYGRYDMISLKLKNITTKQANETVDQLSRGETRITVSY